MPMAALVATLMLLAIALGVLPLPLAVKGACLATLGAVAHARMGRQGWGLRRQLLLLSLLVLAWLWGLQGQPQPGPHDPVRWIPPNAFSTAATLQGELSSDPQRNSDDNGCRVLLQQQGGRSELLFQTCPRLQEGWRITATGRLQRPRQAPHPLLSSAAERLERQGSWSQLRVEHWQLLERPATPVADLRRRMAEALMASGGPQAGGVLAALVLGSAVVPVPAEVREAFRVAGLSHALAASGFHLTVLLGAVMAFGRNAPRPLRWGLALGAMALFLVLAGPQPSVVRAVAMGVIAFAVQECGRRVKPLGVLLACGLLMLLASPAWLLDVGFELSVAATAGLLLSAAPLEQRLRCHLPTWGAAAVAVPLAASLWTLPLQLLHFGALPLYAVPANLMVAPLLTPLTLGAMAMAVAAVLLPLLVPLLGWALVPLTRLFVAMAQLVAHLPLAQWQLGQMAPALVLVLSLGLLPWLVPLQRSPQRLRCGGAALMAIAMTVHLGLQRGDQLLHVQDGPRDLLLARHGGRAALVSGLADGLSCSRASRLAAGLGVQRYDWILLLDPVASERPACWRALSPTVLAQQSGSPALAAGQRLSSPGLSVRALSDDSQALTLEAGQLHWALLPDRQAWWRWNQLGQPHGRGQRDGVWLGFRPSRREQQTLPALPKRRLWWPSAGSGSGWRLC